MARNEYPALQYDLIEEVRDWSNRDSEVLSDKLIARCLEYAADTAYRDLHIPALERTASWTITDSDLVTDARGRLGNITEGRYVILRVPVDAVTFMHLRVEDTGIVFNEKVDDRTFFDITAVKTSFNRFARIGSDLHVAGDFNVGDTLLLHYRRRLAGLGARYAINSYNYDTERTYLTDTDDMGQTMISNTVQYTVDGQLVYPTQYNVTDSTGNIIRTEYLIGRQLPNWLRDDNRKVLVFGALYHAMSYLGDDQMMMVWQNKANSAVDELNREEDMRRASGGNVAMNYTSHLL